MKITWNNIDNFKLMKSGLFRKGRTSYILKNSCKVCGNSYFIQQGCKGEYCSRQCLYVSNDKRVIVKCSTCGKDIKIKRYKLSIQSNFYCNNLCKRNKSDYTKQNIPLYNTYAKQLEPYGIKCRRSTQDQNVLEVQCMYCGKWYQPTRSLLRHKYLTCSPDCNKKIQYNDKAYTYDFVKQYIESNGYTLLSNEYINTHSYITVKCNNDHKPYKVKFYKFMQNQRCPICSNNGISKQEQELQQWLSEYIDIKTNDRDIISPFELDILIPSKKIAIEYNGLYWHSERQGKDKNYHLDKYNLCKEQGYRLISIYENEWLFKQHIVKSIILNAIGIHKEKIHGRKCVIKDVKPKKARLFYDENHIQGFKGGNHKGLYYQNNLVSLMSINSIGVLERFVNKCNTLVHGAFSKLLKAFNLNYIYTFADIRYFTGDVYKKNGFKYCYNVIPRYWYYNNRLNIYHRRTFQRKNIQHKYEKGELTYFDPDKTEYENMLYNGYDRIWDCGKIKFIL